MEPQQLLQTGDGSITLYSTEYNEAYHSTGGALREAFTKFSTPCRIDSLARRGSIAILDIGFGLGYNALAAIYSATSANPACRIEVTSLEKEVLPSALLHSICPPHEMRKAYDCVKKAARTLSCSDEGVTLSLRIGDARQTLKELKTKYDAVFLDPFSVKKNPELWTVDFFRAIAQRMTEEAILATYSASTPVRCGLMAAGFRIGPGPGDAMKREGTLATLKGEVGAFSRKILDRLERSPEKMPFYDPQLNHTREEIIAGRKALQQNLDHASCEAK